MKRVLTTAATLLSLIFTSTGIASEHPNLARGYAPQALMDIRGLDDINLFNGSMTVPIRVGPRYPLSESFSYGLTLIYSSNIWSYYQYAENPEDPLPDWQMSQFAWPDHGKGGLGNAGVGWRVSFGELLEPLTALNWSPNWMYVSADGARHSFQGCGMSCTASVTADGSFIRFSRTGDSVTLELPDGAAHTFEPFDGFYDPSFSAPGVGQVWRVNQMEDAFGNWVTLDWPVFDGQDSELEITDSEGRVHTVLFHWGIDARRRNIDSVTFTMTDGTTAVYDFFYKNGSAGTAIPRACDSLSHSDIRVPLLERVALPDGSYYEMTYDEAPADDSCMNRTDHHGRKSGTLRTMRLPTGGVLEWDYGYRSYPEGATICGGSDHENVMALWEGVNFALGVTRRTLHREGGRLAEWSYDYEDGLIQHPPLTALATTVTDPAGNQTVHHFNVDINREDTIDEPGHGCPDNAWTGWDYGLPFDRDQQLAGENLYLSTERFENRSGTLAAVQRTYVAYTHDELPPVMSSSKERWLDSNRRIIGQRTYYIEDTDDGSYPGGWWQETRSSEYDGFGNHRLRVTSSADGQQIEVFTGYNPSDTPPTYPSVDVSPYTNHAVGFISAWPSDRAWILGTYDSIRATHGTRSITKELCFDDHGFLTRRRLLRDDSQWPVRGPHDVIQVSDHHPDGSKAYSKLYGGDVQTVSTGELCTLSLPSNEQYETRYYFDHGAMSLSVQRDELGVCLNPSLVDRDIDAGTGLTVREYELSLCSDPGSGIVTEYEYDDLGRVIRAKPANDAWTEINYVNALGSTADGTYQPARVEVHRVPNGGGSPLTSHVYTYDPFGRTTKESHQLPGADRWNQRLFRYDDLGRLTHQSQWQENGTDGGDILWTEHADFDAFDRYRLIIPPDAVKYPEHEISLDFFGGVRRQARTVSVGTTYDPATGTVLETPSTTSTWFDLAGRIARVEIPAGPNDEPTIAAYEYDPAGNLERVHLTGTVLDNERSTVVAEQERLFEYDGAGFLMSETLPELGPHGNSTVYYSDYDPMGNQGRVEYGTSGSSFDLQLGHDRAGRLTTVHEAVGAQRVIEQRDYYPSTSGAGFAGRLKKATRSNYFEDGSVVDVATAYTYNGRGARVDQLSTTVTHAAETPPRQVEFLQSLTWNELGKVDTHTYPDHQTWSGDPQQAVTYGYDHGWLDEVWIQYRDSAWGPHAHISYHPSGLVHRVLRLQTNPPYHRKFFDVYGVSKYRTDRTACTVFTTPRPDIELWRPRAYFFDGAGNVLGQKYSDWGNLDEPYCTVPSFDAFDLEWSTYDTAKRLRVHNRRGTEVPSDTYDFDAFGNLTDRSTFALQTDPSTNQMQASSYDEAGHLRGWGAGTNIAYWYAYHPNRELQSVKTGSNPSSPSRTRKFAYDSNNERLYIFDDATNEEEYSIRGPGAKLLRLFKRSRDTASWALTQEYFYRGNTPLALRNEDEDTLPLHVDYLGNVRFVGYDYRNDPAEYTAYGSLLGGQLQRSRLLFTGQERDLADTPETTDDLDYFHQRYYNMHLGRFLTMDPVRGDPANPLSWNAYSYALGNPLRYTDPTGESVWDLADPVFFAVSVGNLWRKAITGEHITSEDNVQVVGDALGLLPVVPALGTGRRLAKESVELGVDAMRSADNASDAARARREGRAITDEPPNPIYSARELVRRAEDGGPFHNFPESFNESIFKGKRQVIDDDYVLYTKRGSINGVEGTFEIGVRPSASGRTEVITHRFFNPDK